MTVFARSVLPVLLLGSLLTGCATHSDGTAPLNQRTWPICSLLGGLVGGGLGAIESAGWAGGGAALGILTGGLICYAQDGDEDSDGVFDRRDRCPDTPENTEVDHRGCPLPVYPAATKAPEPAPQTEVITLSDAGDVLFDFDKSDLRADAASSLDKAAELIKSYAAAPLTVVGHTDGKGTDAYNDSLSLRRAEAVARALHRRTGRQAAVQGQGKRQPVAPNTTPDGRDDPQGRQLNRRVQILIGVPSREGR